MNLCPRPVRGHNHKKEDIMLKFLLGVIAALLFSAVAITARMKNPYKLYVVVGAKGAGKTAYLAKLCNEHERKRKGRIYSNCGIGLELPDHYWDHSYPQNSLLLIDEIGLIHDNRDFKAFEAECNEFYKYQRKKKLVIIATSQSMDIDKKIRTLTDYICVSRRFLCFGLVIRYRTAIVLADDPVTGGQKLTDTEKFSGIQSIYFLPSTFELFDTLKEAVNVATKRIRRKD